jgi:hypothetical protein
MNISSRTPEGEPNSCPICGNDVRMEPSSGFRDAPCPHCGHLLRFLPEGRYELATPGASEEDGVQRTQRCLQKLFEHAGKQIAQGNHDYAAELLSQCILGDPGNVIYVRTFVENLRKKYNNNRKGAMLASFKERGARRLLKEVETQQRWHQVIGYGLRVLQVNPWDVPTLRSMATAAEKLGADECELHYLKCALESDPKDVETNMLCAKAAEKHGHFDQASDCRHRTEQNPPSNNGV